MQILTDREGRSVRFTDERKAHMLNHPEMEGLEPDTKNALREPQLVIRSATDESVQLYYYYIQKTLVGAKWLCIVVKYTQEDAFVLTAYLTDKPKQGEQIWPRK